MAPPPLFSHRHVILLLFLLFIATTVAVEEDELDSVLTVLRARGHMLFSNAIATSDLVYEIINSGNSSSFTFFAPTDSSLFALDMTRTASDYNLALRCHVIPLRLSLNELRRFHSRYAIRTLLKNHQIRIENHRSNEMISVDGVGVVSPGLFYSRQIAVHGLGGVLSCLRSGRESIQARAPHSVFAPAESSVPEETEPPALSEYSPAYNSVSGIPTASTFPYGTEAPEPSDGPTTFPPERLGDELQMMGVDTEEEEREITLIHSISPVDLTAIIETEL